jgi:hypothetical protein
MRRVLLILPPIRDFYFTFARNYPLGILYLATVLNREGFKVRILNALEYTKKVTLKIPPHLSYLRRYHHTNKSPFKLFTNFYHFGLQFGEIENFIRDYNPEIVGISANFACYFESARRVAQITKRIDKRIVTVIGGHFPTAAPQIPLKERSIDFLIRGEGEYSLLELCKRIDGRLKEIEGLCYRLNSRLYISKMPALVRDLDSLPIPEGTLLNSKGYKLKDNLYASLITSRGCGLGCQYLAQ